MFSELTNNDFSFFQNLSEEDRFCNLDQDFCFPEITPFPMDFSQLPSTQTDSHSTGNSDHTKEEESLNSLHFSPKNISIDAQPEEKDILAAFEPQESDIANPRSTICANPHHKECQAFQARVFGNTERSARGRKAKTETKESEDLHSMISKKLFNLEKRRDNSNQTLIGLIKHSLKLILKNRPKQPKTKDYDIAQSLIAQIGFRADSLCIESALESLETKIGKSKKKDSYAQPSFAGLEALHNKNPFLKDWISFLLIDIRDQISSPNRHELEAVLVKINERLN